MDKDKQKKLEKAMGYKDHVVPKRCCGNCGHSYCHNPGANISGLSCEIMGAVREFNDGIVGVVDGEGFMSM
jgi:hypothetical protein